jgi:hypothetical protein
MAHPGAAASGHRRPTLAGLLSVAFHGGAIALVAALAGRHVAHAPPAPPPKTVPVAVTQPAILPAAAPASAPAVPRASAEPSAPAERPAPPTPPAIQAKPAQRAPIAMKSLADLTISYDDARLTTLGPTTKTDAAGGPGRSGIGAGVAYRRADGVATFEIPQPVTVSLARKAKPKRDYSNLRIVGASRFAGETVKLLLMIDAHGKVHGAQLLQGVDHDLDRKTIELARTFEYEPALDDAGIAIQGTSRWEIQIVEDEEGDMFQTAREHRRR